jgi:hypothetical protein
MILNFFSNIPHNDQKIWKKLLTANLDIDYTLINNFPQLESQLKVLYTAITRSCNRLVFVETRVTVAGSAFFRWLHEKQIAMQLKVSSMNEVLMTSDEWRIRGIEFALLAEADVIESMLQKALFCFDHAGDIPLRTRVNILLELHTCKKKLNAITNDIILQSKDEIDISNCIYKCLRVGLVTDVLDVCDLLCERSCEPRYFLLNIRQKLEKLRMHSN